MRFLLPVKTVSLILLCTLYLYKKSKTKNDEPPLSLATIQLTNFVIHIVLQVEGSCKRIAERTTQIDTCSSLSVIDVIPEPFWVKLSMSLPDSISFLLLSAAMFYRIAALKNFSKLNAKHLQWGLIFIPGLQLNW